MVMMHVWFIGLCEHSGEFAGRNNVRPLFLLPGFFSLVEILGLGFGVLSSDISGLGGLSTLGQPPLFIRLLLKYSTSGAGSLVGI